MKPEILAAIISGAAVVLAAVIAGIFKIKKSSEEKDNQSAQAGGHVIQASGQVTQNINISEQITQPYEKKDLLAVTSQINKYANGILIENEKILSPIFSENPQRKKINKNMEKLFHIQHGRASFGEWQGYLTSMLDSTKNQIEKDLVTELLTLLSQLHDSLYAYNSPSSTLPLHKYQMLANIKDDVIAIEHLQLSAKYYLENLRSIIEKIGVITGRLKSLS